MVFLAQPLMEKLFPNFGEADCDIQHNETMNTTSFEISTDNKEVLDALKELGVKKARKVKEIKTNDLYIVECLNEKNFINHFNCSHQHRHNLF